MLQHMSPSRHRRGDEGAAAEPASSSRRLPEPQPAARAESNREHDVTDGGSTQPRDDAGTSMVEYGLLAVAVAVVLVLIALALTR
jgi:hypothetical protein